MGASHVLNGPLLEALIVRCAARDSRALDELYREAAPALLGCLMHMLRRRDLAEDVLHCLLYTSDAADE